MICLSENIQNEIKTLKFKKKITAEKPNEQSFLRIIKNFSKGKNLNSNNKESPKAGEYIDLKWN